MAANHPIIVLVMLMCVTGHLAGADAPAQTISPISTNAQGTPANAMSSEPSISADGRYVAFDSSATNLVPGDTNGTTDVFVKDRQTGTVARVSVRADGTEAIGSSHRPRLSSDGRFVVFVSGAALVPGDTNQCGAPVPAQATCSDIYIHDRITGEISRVSVAADGSQSNGSSYNPDVTGDGRFVVFASGATNLTPDDVNPGPDIFLRDRTAGTTTRISIPSPATATGFQNGSPAISDDGETVIFFSNGEYGSPAPFTCGGFTCSFPWVYSRVTGSVRRLEMQLPSTSHLRMVRSRILQLDLARDGRSAAGVLLHEHWVGSSFRRT